MTNIEYTKNLNDIDAEMLNGFFVGWPNPPSKYMHLKILKNSYCSYIAIDKNFGKVVGFVNAISDGILTAYIPLLEVLPDYKGNGIGSELIKLMLEELKDIYMVDICHDKDLIPYYAKFKPYQSYASVFRKYEVQSGRI